MNAAKLDALETVLESMFKVDEGEDDEFAVTFSDSSCRGKDFGLVFFDP